MLDGRFSNSGLTEQKVLEAITLYKPPCFPSRRESHRAVVKNPSYNQFAWKQSPALPSTSCVTRRKCLNIFQLRILICKMVSYGP